MILTAKLPLQVPFWLVLQVLKLHWVTPGPTAHWTSVVENGPVKQGPPTCSPNLGSQFVLCECSSLCSYLEYLSFLFVLVFRLLCSLGWPGIYYVDQTGFELKILACFCLLSAGLKGILYQRWLLVLMILFWFDFSRQGFSVWPWLSRNWLCSTEFKSCLEHTEIYLPLSWNA